MISGFAGWTPANKLDSGSGSSETPSEDTSSPYDSPTTENPYDSGSSGYNSWENRFPEDTRTGTENPSNDAEKTQRIAYLENKIYELKELVRGCDAAVDEAKGNVDRLENLVRDLTYKINEAEGRHNRLNSEQGGLEGKQAGVRARREAIESTPNWRRNDSLVREWESLDTQRWNILDELGRVTDAKGRAWDQLNDLKSSQQQAEWDLSSARDTVNTRQDDWVARKEQLSELENELNWL